MATLAKPKTFLDKRAFALIDRLMQKTGPDPDHRPAVIIATDAKAIIAGVGSDANEEPRPPLPCAALARHPFCRASQNKVPTVMLRTPARLSHLPAVNAGSFFEVWADHDSQRSRPLAPSAA